MHSNKFFKSNHITIAGSYDVKWNCIPPVADAWIFILMQKDTGIVIYSVLEKFTTVWRKQKYVKK